MRFLSAFALACVLLSALVALGSAGEVGSTRGGLAHLQRAVEQSQLDPVALAETDAAVEVTGEGVITVFKDEEDKVLIAEIAKDAKAVGAVKSRKGRSASVPAALISAARKAPRRDAAGAPAKSNGKNAKGTNAPKGAKDNGRSARATSKASNAASAPPRRGGKAAKFLELDVAIQSEIEAEAEAEAEAETTATAYPTVTLNTAGSVRALRQLIQADPPGLTINGFVYTLDNSGPALTHGRINHAHGFVTASTTTRPAKAVPVEYCDVLFRPTALPYSGVAGTRTNVGRALIQSGHIIAHSLGGSSDHAINFYPQFRQSNNQGGRWGRIEGIALQVAAICPANTVIISIDFNAWDATNGVYPIGGNYYIVILPACQTALTANCATGVAAPATWHSYVRVFCRHATQIAGQPVGTKRYTTPFSNNANDIITAAARDAHFVP